MGPGDDEMSSYGQYYDADISPQLQESLDRLRQWQTAVETRERRATRLLQFAAGAFIISLIMLTLLWASGPTLLQCSKLTSPYSSIWEAVDFWEGDLVNYFNHSTIYRGPPSLEREIAWNDLWHRPGIPIDSRGIAALNKTNVANPAEIVGSSPERPVYGAYVEVFHQLHCLNLIRQATWPLDHFSKSWGMLYPWNLEEPVAGRMHIDHCLETLRLSLMCYGDITPMLLLDDEDPHFVGTADFNVHHKCRDFDKIVEYVEDNGIEIHWPGGMKPDHNEEAKHRF